MTKIEVHGRGLSFSLTEITPELAKELTKTGITEERYELEDELETPDEDESGITSDLEVHVDGEKIASPYEGHSGIANASNVPSSQLGEPGKYYFLSIMEEKGIWLKAETSEVFEPEKLQIEIFDYILPDKETIRLAHPSYAGMGEFGFTNVNVQDEYVIYPDGARHEIELLEDED